MQSNDQFIHTFTNLTRDERKKFAVNSTKFVAAEDETDRIHAAYPDLRDKLRVLSYDLHFDASTSGAGFWLNRGKKYDMECEITTPNDGPQTLSLRVSYWSVEGKSDGDWTTIEAAYRGSTAKFVADACNDGGGGWGNAVHGNLKHVFRRVAVDAGLLGGDRAEDSVLEKMVKAFLGDEVCTRSVYEPAAGREVGRDCQILEIILRELAWEYDEYD